MFIENNADDYIELCKKGGELEIKKNWGKAAKDKTLVKCDTMC
jgi:hypothetical protein